MIIYDYAKREVEQESRGREIISTYMSHSLSLSSQHQHPHQARSAGGCRGSGGSRQVVSHSGHTGGDG